MFSVSQIRSVLKCSMSGLSMLLCLSPGAQAHEAGAAWPTQSLRMVVPFPAGGPTDVVARIVAQQAGVELGRQIVVDNRPGAGGTIGVSEVARADADGYTLLLTTSSTHAVSPHLFTAFSYNVKTDFTPIAHVGSAGSVLLVAPALPVRTVQELINHAAERPGKLNYGSSGSGTIVHLVTEAFMSQAGIKMTHMPYKGTGQARADLLDGSLQLLIDAIPTGMPYVRKGELRALAVTTRERSPLAPAIPTLDESGLRGVDFTTWFGVYTPAGLSPERRELLHDAFSRALQDPEVVMNLTALGVTPAAPHTPEEFAALVDADSARWKQIIEDSNVSIR